MRCKLSCQRARELRTFTYPAGGGPAVEGKTAEAVELYAVYTDSPEDREFARATPNARFDLYVDNPAAWGFFQEGKSYYVDISPAE